MSTQTISEGVPPPAFKGDVAQSKGMLSAGTAYDYRSKVVGPHGANLKLTDHSTVLRKAGGDDMKAAFVGARGVTHGVATFSFKILRSAHSGLGTYVGVADAAADFNDSAHWGRAWAMGCHGQNLFSWEDGFEVASYVRGALPGSDTSLSSGDTVTVKVDMEKRELSFAVNGGQFVAAAHVTLPASVRPFCKLSGEVGDSVSLVYEDDVLDINQINQKDALAAAGGIENADGRMSVDVVKTGALGERASGDSVLVREVM